MSAATELLAWTVGVATALGLATLVALSLL